MAKITARQTGGYFVFAFSWVLYLITLSPTVSFWDSGEFIACANGLEIGHAPGAPFYLMLSKVLSAFVPAASVAFCINLLSAIASAVTIWLLYSTLLLIIDKIKDKQVSRSPDNSFILPALVGSLTFAVSDTFWFSAVEAEVYALSLLFTAFTLWAVLKWETELPNTHAHRWLLLIAFSMGLSVGVHLLNLLCIPVIFYWVYIHLYPNKKHKHVQGLAMGLAVLFIVHFLVVENGLFLAKKMELWAVNVLNMPLHSGLLCFVALLLSLMVAGIYFFRRRNQLVHFLFLTSSVFLLGLSSYAMVIIRANAYPAINLNSPTDVFSLESFINREQYGQRPLLRGEWFGAEHTQIEPDFNYRVNDQGKYESYPQSQKIKYKKEDLNFLQRMYSPKPQHIQGYRYWTGLQDGERPTLMHQVEFMLRYQIGHMYFRYFMWNFSGRQNHYQGHGDFLNGNFTTGFPFIDSRFLGSRHFLHSNELTSRARNHYFMLPLLFGFIGILLLVQRKKWSVLLFLGGLFLLTGVGITLYLNQPPYEPRERDYVFVGSFYAYALFIGIGVWALLQKIKQLSPSRFTQWAALIAVLLALPGLMLANNFNDHTRNDRTLARDLAASYLNSCAPNAILFTYGDNDTYPLWYLQQVEGLRRDVSVVNIGLLSADWYIFQQTVAQKGRKPLQFSIPVDRYKTGDLDYVAVVNSASNPITLDHALGFVGDTAANTRLALSSTSKLDYIPSNQLQLNKASGSTLNINKSYLTKGEVALIDMIASNYSSRPIYFGNGTPASAIIGFNRYVFPYGIVGRLLLDMEQPDTEELYRLLTEKVQLGIPVKSWWDQTCTDAIRLSGLQKSVQELARSLLQNGQREKAQHLLEKYVDLSLISHTNSPETNLPWIEVLFKAGLNKMAVDYLEKSTYSVMQDFNFYSSSQIYLGDNMSYYAKSELLTLKKLHAIARAHGAMELAQWMEAVLMSEGVK
ncbi:glycosyltransferase family 117 protein [Saccharicrinis carchari]|uniref:glycosyltransferase family 117 protein n=1 Tax=Saccharicrinis carchari TaxID=1168039 RepID=UPI00163DA457|nr:DUF2723 domain-containing protein [Saccharicrinis carchari]